MEIVIAAAVLAAGLVVAALLLVKRAPGLVAAGAVPTVTPRATTEAKEAHGQAETDSALARRQDLVVGYHDDVGFWVLAGLAVDVDRIWGAPRQRPLRFPVRTSARAPHR